MDPESSHTMDPESSHTMGTESSHTMDPESSHTMDPESSHTMQGTESSETIQLAALGRHFRLGMLYDCRKDSLIPELTLWDYEDLEKEASKRPQPSTEFEIVASETLEDKTSSLNVEASLKASFLGGLVNVDGSAKYLNDSKTSQNQARVTLKYKTTTELRELSMNELRRANTDHPSIFDSGIATHVVTGILYGAQTFFVFDCEVSDEENCQAIESNLKAIIQEGQGSLQVKDTDMAKVDIFSCTVYGDISHDTSPVSFKDAIRVYQNLPNLLEAKEIAVPMKVWLMPLTVLNSSAVQLVHQISNGLVMEAQSVIEDLSALNLRCNDALKSTVAQHFPKISKMLTAFKYLCNEYKQEIQKALAEKLPSIRGGGEEESVLSDILKLRQSSPFNNKDMNEWMDCKEREISIISSLTKNTMIVSSQKELEKMIHSLESQQHFVCFAFNAIQMAEPYLSALSSYLRETPRQVHTQDTALHTHDEEKEQWCFSKDVYQSMTQKAKLLIDFSEANKDNKNVQFFVTATTNKYQKGASIYLYNNQLFVSDNFEPPSKPETPAASDITHNSVTLKMCTPRFGAEDSHYSIEYCVTGQDGWQQQTTSKADEVTVSNLTPNTEYKFRYRALCPVGKGPASEVSDAIKTLPTSPPGKPQVEAYSQELSIKWEKPTELGEGVTVERYSVEYAKIPTGMKHEQLQWSKVTSKYEMAIIPELIPITEYVVRVRCECGIAGSSKESITITVQTQTKTKAERLAEFHRRKAKLINSGSPSVYELPLKTNRMDIGGCKSYSFGKESMMQNRTIMVLGATGAGKSTLINGMINYILGINWNDDYRFKLINEGQSKSQAMSQTSEVTVYKLNHQQGFNIPYSLTIVDTPGFGDTGGIDRDKEITDQIRSLFTSKRGVSEINIVCFVTQASLARLTHPQRYVFDSVLSIFGKDIADNIRMLVTFADGHLPPVLEAINQSNVPCPKTEEGLPLHFKFNNSALYADKNCGDEDSDDENFDQMFWNMGMKSLKRFFLALEQIEPQSLQLTKEVLLERRRLETSVEGIQPQLKAGIAKLEQIRMTKQQIQEHEAAISSNENFEIEEEIIKPVQTMIKRSFITNCQQCSVTCHYPCAIADDSQKNKCAAMDSNGNCNVCPGKCVWTVHFNQKYKWDYVPMKVKRTVQELKDKYEKATQQKMTVQQLIQSQEEDIANLEDVIVSLVQKTAACLARLNEIALRPNPLSAPEYIELLIEGEKSEAKVGYVSRIRALEAMKERAKIISKVAKQEQLTETESELYKGGQERQKKPGFLQKLTDWFRDI